MEEKILKELEREPKITQKELAVFLELPQRTLQRKMYELQAAGKIERIGGKRYGHWVTH